MAIIIFRKLLIFVLLLGPALANAEWYSDVQNKMGTRVEVQLWAEDESRAELLLAESMDEIDRIEQLMSTYIEASEMSRVNRAAHAAPQFVSPELFDLLKVSIEMSQLTDGAFDITYDSAGVLYDYRKNVRPDPMQLADSIEHIDYRNIILDEDELTVSFATAGTRINLGGIAKGHAVERVIALLRAAGIEHALATAGGDTRILGDRIEKPWIVGIRDPNDREGVFTRVALEDEAISTSGDYERFFMEDGKRYHHILRPADGKPVAGVRSVSVIGPDATMTDGLSTSVFVLGPQAGLKLIAGLPDYEAIVITDTNVFYSGGLSSNE